MTTFYESDCSNVEFIRELTSLIQTLKSKTSKQLDEQILSESETPYSIEDLKECFSEALLEAEKTNSAHLLKLIKQINRNLMSKAQNCDTTDYLIDITSLHISLKVDRLEKKIKRFQLSEELYSVEYMDGNNIATLILDYAEEW